jgi:hypothetical protein
VRQTSLPKALRFSQLLCLEQISGLRIRNILEEAFLAQNSFRLWMIEIVSEVLEKQPNVVVIPALAALENTPELLSYDFFKYVRGNLSLDVVVELLKYLSRYWF